MKELKDYINFYHNAQFLDLGAEPDDNIIKLESITSMGMAYDCDGNEIAFKELKPILRQLSDMTEDELRDLGKLFAGRIFFSDEDIKEVLSIINKKGIKAIRFEDNTAEDVFEMFRFFLYKNFDLFGLIEAGIAIDKNKITK